MEFNLADLFESVADTVPDQTALVSGARRLTYAQLDRRANRLAHYLETAGIGPGDRFGVQLVNGTEYLEVMLACFKIRAIPINVNYRYVAAELELPLSGRRTGRHRLSQPVRASGVRCPRRQTRVAGRARGG